MARDASPASTLDRPPRTPSGIESPLGVGRPATPSSLPARHFEAALEQQPRQRRAIGRAHAACTDRAGSRCDRRAMADAHGRPLLRSATRRASSRRRSSSTVDDDVGRLDAHVPDAHVPAPAAARRPTRTATSPRADSTRRWSAALRRRARAAARRRAPPSRTGPAPRRTRCRLRTGRSSTAALTSAGTTFAYAQWQ